MIQPFLSVVFALLVHTGEPARSAVPADGVPTAIKTEWQTACTRTVNLTVQTSGCTPAEAAKLAYAVKIPGVDGRLFCQTFRAAPTGNTVVEVKLPVGIPQVVVSFSDDALESLPGEAGRQAYREAGMVKLTYQWTPEVVVSIPPTASAITAQFVAQSAKREVTGRIVLNGQPVTGAPVVEPLAAYGSPVKPRESGTFKNLKIPITRRLLSYRGEHDAVKLHAVPAGTTAVDAGDLSQNAPAATVPLDVTVLPIPSMSSAQAFSGCMVYLLRADGTVAYRFATRLKQRAAPATGDDGKLVHLWPDQPALVPPGEYFVVPDNTATQLVLSYVTFKIIDGVNPETLGVTKLTIPAGQTFTGSINAKELLQGLLERVAAESAASP